MAKGCGAFSLFPTIRVLRREASYDSASHPPQKQAQLMEMGPHRPTPIPRQALPHTSQPSFPAAEASA